MLYPLELRAQMKRLWVLHDFSATRKRGGDEPAGYLAARCVARASVSEYLAHLGDEILAGVRLLDEAGQALASEEADDVLFTVA